MGRYVAIAGRFSVMGGSMGVAHGERVVRAYRRAMLEKLPVVVIATSGGARLQEGLLALAQLARTSAAARAHSRAGLLSVTVVRAPTTGGVWASYASLGDLRAAEPGATLAFSGPRVIEMTTGVPLRAGSHTAESAYAAGLVDALVPRADQACWVETALGLCDTRLPGRPLPAPAAVSEPGSDAWREVLRARARSRPAGIDHAARICDSWVELHGTDPTLRAGLARIGHRRVVVLAHDRYAGTGRPGPSAFRLAQRAVALAGRLALPVLSFVDTPGAEPGAAAEAGGLAAEIAATYVAFAEAPVPIVAVCVGEGGSGGALATSIGDVVLMQEHAVFGVVSPEAAAAILARDPSRAPDFAAQLKLTAADLATLGITTATVGETDDLDAAISRALDQAVPGERLLRLDALSAKWVL